jgi:hypothetical protein
MSKILEHGKPKEPQKAAWVGEVVTCGCGCKYELEQDDSVTYSVEKRPGGKLEFVSTCPECGTKNTTVKYPKAFGPQNPPRAAIRTEFA